MKITVTYIAAEERLASEIVSVLRRLLPGARVHEVTAKPPYIRVYLTTRKPGGP